MPQTVPSQLRAIVYSLVNLYQFRCRNVLMLSLGALNRNHIRQVEHLKSFATLKFQFGRALLGVLLGLTRLIS